MTEIIRIDPPMELDTPRGRAQAHFLIDYHLGGNLVWVCFQRDTGECWSYSNPEVLLPPCETSGVRSQSPGGGRWQPATVVRGRGRYGATGALPPAPADSPPALRRGPPAGGGGPTGPGAGGPPSEKERFPLGRVVRARKPWRKQ